MQWNGQVKLNEIQDFGALKGNLQVASWEKSTRKIEDRRLPENLAEVSSVS